MALHKFTNQFLLYDRNSLSRFEFFDSHYIQRSIATRSLNISSKVLIPSEYKRSHNIINIFVLSKLNKKPNIKLITPTLRKSNSKPIKSTLRKPN